MVECRRQLGLPLQEQELKDQCPSEAMCRRQLETLLQEQASMDRAM
jgi:hypothetical protein